jgi:hypothetical protein
MPSEAIILRIFEHIDRLPINSMFSHTEARGAVVVMI